MKMNQDTKTEWVKALRSGEYRQSAESLRCNGGFCCLGVLCDILDPEGWSQSHNLWQHNQQDDYPSKDLRLVAGLDQSNMWTLATLNDEGASFETIADHIEKNL